MSKSVLSEIQARNARVEADKAWETSFTRRLILALAIYALAAFMLFSIDAPEPWLNALVPALAYLLSTLTLPFLKQYWLENFYRK